MAFLAPLFLAGLAAIALPVLLHLRRNRPQQTVAFSSLMFLEASPPTVRRRARLQDVLLLILRCIALALLVLAFARPFFPAENPATPAADGAVLNYLLIDASASMGGAPLEKALKSAEGLIDEISTNDWIAVAGFSDRLRPLLGPQRARELTGSERKSSARAALASVQADASATALDAAVLAALAAAGQEVTVKLHVISDFQKGAAIERLRDEVWPGNVQIIPHFIPPPDGWSNAGLRLLPPEKQIQRVRVTNSEGSAKSDFSLAWGGPAVAISVPPGESAIFDAPEGTPGEGRVTLTGDGFNFDNEASWSTPPRPVARIWTPGASGSSDPAEGAYFLGRALQSTPEYTVEISSETPKTRPALTVVGGSLDAPAVAALRGFLSGGGNALLALSDVESAQGLAQLVGAQGAAREAMVADHARFGEIDFNSNVFAPFADARYSDFSNIRVWKYRVLPAALTARGGVLARFDSGDPAWLAFPIGKGTLHVLTTTWRPVDSQLALTTKFPPLLHSLLVLNDAAQMAAQLDPAESELTPLPVAELRALGLPLDPPADPTRSHAAVKISQEDQENRQRFGWWLLVAAAVFFLAETALAALSGGRLTPATS